MLEVAQNRVGMAHWMMKRSRSIAVGKSEGPIESTNNANECAGDLANGEQKCPNV